MKTPKTPDYEGAAQAQGQANIDVARFNANNNRPDTFTPTGQQTWVKHPTDPDRWVLREELTPDQQALLDKTENIQNAGLSSLEAAMPEISKAIFASDWKLPGQAATSLVRQPKWGVAHELTGMDGAPGIQSKLDETGVQGIPVPDAAMRQNVGDALYKAHSRNLDPQFAQGQHDLEVQLRNQGIARGSDAWNRELDNFNRNKQNAYDQARTSSITGSGQEMTNQFGMGLSAHQQGMGNALSRLGANNAGQQQYFDQAMGRTGLWNQAVGQDYDIANMETQTYNNGRQQQLQEMFAGKTMPLNIMASMLGNAQLQMPNFQPYNNNITADAPPIFNAAVAQGQANIGAANSRNAFYGNLMGAGANLGSAAIKYSDRRMKSKIQRIGTTPGGTPWYSYEIAGVPGEGVMADEVDDSAKMLVNGFWMVDYSKVR